MSVLITIMCMFAMMTWLYAANYNRKIYKRELNKTETAEVEKKVYPGTLEYNPGGHTHIEKKPHPVKKSYMLADDNSVEILEVIQQAELEASPNYVPPNQDGCMCEVDITCTACEFRKNWEKNKNKTAVVLPKGVSLISGPTPVWEREARVAATKMGDTVLKELQNVLGNQKFGYKGKFADGTNYEICVDVKVHKPYEFEITEMNKKIIHAITIPQPLMGNHETVTESSLGSREKNTFCWVCGIVDVDHEHMYNTDIL